MSGLHVCDTKEDFPQLDNIPQFRLSSTKKTELYCGKT